MTQATFNLALLNIALFVATLAAAIAANNAMVAW